MRSLLRGGCVPKCLLRVLGKSICTDTHFSHTPLGCCRYAEYQYVCSTEQIEAKQCFGDIDMYQLFDLVPFLPTMPHLPAHLSSHLLQWWCLSHAGFTSVLAKIDLASDRALECIDRGSLRAQEHLQRDNACNPRSAGKATSHLLPVLWPELPLTH